MQKFLLIVSVFTILPIFECIVAKNIELPITEITLNYQDESLLSTKNGQG